MRLFKCDKFRFQKHVKSILCCLAFVECATKFRVRNACFSTGYFCCALLAAPNHADSSAHIFSLATERNPHAVISAIVQVAVPTFQGISHWGHSHILNKDFKTFHPFSTNCNSSSTVVWEVPVVWISTSFFHVQPCRVRFFESGISALSVPVSWPPVGFAPAMGSLSNLYVTPREFPNMPTVTSALYSFARSAAAWCCDDKRTESLSNRFNGFHAATHKPVKIHVNH